MTCKDRIKRNFGCPQPEGYRKSLRLMRQAERFGRAVVCFVDTQGRVLRQRGRGARPGQCHRRQPVCHGGGFACPR